MGLFDLIKEAIFGDMNKKTADRPSSNVPVKVCSSNLKFYSKSETLSSAAKSESTPMGDSWAYEVDGLENIRPHRDRFIAIDLETTGFSVENGDRIIEIGAILFENGVKVKEFDTLVDPERLIPSAASRVNHIYDHDVAGAPKIREALSMLSDFLGGATIGNPIVVAHNAPFDLKFLMTAFNYCGYSVEMKYVDTLKWSRKLVRGIDNYKLGSVAKLFKIKNKKAHRAASDAEVCGEIFYKLTGLPDFSLLEHHAAVRKGDYPLTSEETEVCAYIQKSIISHGGSIDNLRFYKNSSGYVDLFNPFKFMTFKIQKDGKAFIIVPNDVADMVVMRKKPCIKSEGIDNNTRCFFLNIFELEPLNDYFFSAFQKGISDLNSAFSYAGYTEDNVRELLRLTVSLTEKRMDECLSSAEERKAELERASAELCNEPDNGGVRKPVSGIAVIQLDDEGNVVNTYPSVAEASRIVGVNSKSIREVLKGAQKHAGGYKWAYEGDLPR